MERNTKQNMTCMFILKLNNACLDINHLESMKINTIRSDI